MPRAKKLWGAILTRNSISILILTKPATCFALQTSWKKVCASHCTLFVLGSRYQLPNCVESETIYPEIQFLVLTYTIIRLLNYKQD
jgi:hypothetical protein